MDEKVRLVEENRDEHGLNACCEALDLSKGTWEDRQNHYQGEDKDPELKEIVNEIVEEHPGYGYRPMIVELEEEYDKTVNHKRLRRLLNTWQLALKRTVSKPPKSGIQEILEEASGQPQLGSGVLGSSDPAI